MIRTKHYYAAAALLLALPLALHGRVNEASPNQSTPAIAADIEEEDEVLLEEVRSLVFYGDHEETPRPPGEIEAGIVIRDLDIPAEGRFRMTMERHLERPLTQRTLRRITDEAVLHYRRADLPVVDVIVPEQDITEGVVRILILEGRVTALRTEGNRYFPNVLLRREIRLQPGDRIRGEALREDIEWLNRNPFREVNAVFSPGEHPGETELTLMTRDRPPVRLYAGYENTGHPLTSRHRGITGFNWGNAFNLDHQLNYRFTVDDRFRRFKGHAASYVAPLPWRHIATLSGGYINTEADLDPPFDLTGRSWQTSARYAVPLPRPHRTTFSHEFRLGADFKNTNTNLQFGGEEVFDTEVEVAQGMAGYEAAWKDRGGENFVGIDLFYSPGGVTSRNTDEVFDEARPGARSEYVYGRLRAERETDLPFFDLAWHAEGTAQAAGERLFFTEQLGAGGYRSVRGYREREANGDGGFFLRNEIRTPERRVLWRNTHATLLAFLDVAEVRVRSPRADEDRSTSLAGAGAGLRYRIGRHLHARLDLGFALSRTPETDPGDARLHVGVTASY